MLKKRLATLKTDGSAIELAGGGLEALQKAVGGYIEYVRLPNGAALVVNEEGLLQELPINVLACVLSGRTIVGDVVYAESMHDVCGGCVECADEGTLT
jgi:hypothetical protein